MEQTTISASNEKQSDKSDSTDNRSVPAPRKKSSDNDDKAEDQASTTEKYLTDLNRFGDEEGDTPEAPVPNEYPADFNPFGDEEYGDARTPTAYPDKLDPFYEYRDDHTNQKTALLKKISDELLIKLNEYANSKKHLKKHLENLENLKNESDALFEITEEDNKYIVKWNEQQQPKEIKDIYNILEKMQNISVGILNGIGKKFKERLEEANKINDQDQDNEFLQNLHEYVKEDTNLFKKGLEFFRLKKTRAQKLNHRSGGLIEVTQNGIKLNRTETGHTEVVTNLLINSDNKKSPLRQHLIKHYPEEANAIEAKNINNKVKIVVEKNKNNLTEKMNTYGSKIQFRKITEFEKLKSLIEELNTIQNELIEQFRKDMKEANIPQDIQAEEKIFISEMQKQEDELKIIEETIVRLLKEKPYLNRNPRTRWYFTRVATKDMDSADIDQDLHNILRKGLKKGENEKLQKLLTSKGSSKLQKISHRRDKWTKIMVDTLTKIEHDRLQDIEQFHIPKKETSFKKKFSEFVLSMPVGLGVVSG